MAPNRTAGAGAGRRAETSRVKRNEYRTGAPHATNLPFPARYDPPAMMVFLFSSGRGSCLVR